MALGWLWWRAWFLFDAVVAAAVGGVALGDIDLHFMWQGWRLVTSTSTSRGGRSINGTGLALVAHFVPMALGDIDAIRRLNGRISMPMTS